MIFKSKNINYWYSNFQSWYDARDVNHRLKYPAFIYQNGDMYWMENGVTLKKKSKQLIYFLGKNKD
jgi:lantibiotic modifying enzyme